MILVRVSVLFACNNDDNDDFYDSEESPQDDNVVLNPEEPRSLRDKFILGYNFSEIGIFSM